jgi:hypothetical protein
MHHKRRRAKNRRAGCLMCKPWKINGVAREGSNRYEWRLKPSERRRIAKGPDDNGERERPE